MLERNRGARRERTRSKKAPALHALERYVEGPWYRGETRRELKRLFLRNQGRNEIRDWKCGDCWQGGPCDWCYGGTLRKQRRLHDSLDADFKAWKFSEVADEAKFRAFR